MREWQNRSQQVGDQVLFDNQMIAEFTSIRKQLVDTLSRVDKLEEMLKSTTLQLIAYRTVIETLQEVQQVQQSPLEENTVTESPILPTEETTESVYPDYSYPTHVPTVTVIEEEEELPVRVELVVEENKKAYNLEEEVNQSKPHFTHATKTEEAK